MLQQLISRRRRRRDPSSPDAPSPSTGAGGGADEVLARAEALAADGDPVAAVDMLAAENRHRPDPRLEERLVELRMEAARGRRDGGGREPWPPRYEDPFPGLRGAVPEIPAGTLSTELFGGAVAHHGALMVRGLFSDEQVSRCVTAIDHAHEVRAEVAAGTHEPDSAYRPVRTDTPMKTEVLRKMVGEQGGIWLADSPSATAVALDALHDVGAVAMMTEHFGERPFFSLQKSTLRRSQPEFRLVAWHQDGSFLDEDVRTMNIWVALSPCGGERPTPGLEVVPRRMHEVLPVDGVMSPHSIDYDLVASIAEETPTVVPEFEPGDAIVFDERFLHRTHLPTEMDAPRYALECWFFAPSHHTESYIPLLA